MVDIFVSDIHFCALYRNEGNEIFSDATIPAGIAAPSGQYDGCGASFFDFDNDGDRDVFIINLGGHAVLLRNEGLDRNNWLEIQLIGTTSTRDGVGAKVKVTANGKMQIAQKKSSSGYLSTNDPRMHFGLGKNEVVDKVEIIWPSGKSQRVENVRAGQILTIREQ